MKNRIAIKITLIYFVLGFLWILFSDRLILSLAGSTDTITAIQTYKGWFYVTATAVFLYLLIAYELKKKNQIEADLVKAKKKAEESDLLKSAFLSNLSHEIRTPMNGILGFCELLLDDSFKEDDKQIFARNLTQNSSDLLRLINDIMDISRIQENQYEVIKRKFNLNNILEKIEQEFRLSEIGKMRQNVVFSIDKPDGSENLEIFSDPVLLTHIFQKLLSNAFFFTQEGFIRFGYQMNDQKIEFFVEDSGCGIDESNKDLYFKPFFKGKNQAVGNKGFGLGLAISKGLANILGSDLQFTSAPKKGSRFYFTLDKGIIVK
ncbi:MAG: HAMP domain-containing histidine kinase [Prolixibacteraceae bacterium]|nr:HAMP domain-containing histidine kinase [Prolixibacteraceae bacterium]